MKSKFHEDSDLRVLYEHYHHHCHYGNGHLRNQKIINIMS